MNLIHFLHPFVQALLPMRNFDAERCFYFCFTGLAQNEYGWWYIRSGMLDFSYTGYVNWYGTAYRVQNGQVIF